MHRLEAALDLEYDITSEFTGSYFEEEIKGLADASGADEKTIRRIHMIGELTYIHAPDIWLCFSHVNVLYTQEGPMLHVWCKWECNSQ